jgi:folate-dependent tRNA-U54 methylase TrmFO/GidA
MTKEQFENFMNAMMSGEHEEVDDYCKDVTEKIYQEL